MNIEFKFEDGFVVLEKENKVYKGFLDETLFQCEKNIDILKRPRSIPLMVSMVLKNTEKFETSIDYKNDFACDIHGASASTPREHLKVSFIITENNDKIPVYFNLIHYDE